MSRELENSVKRAKNMLEYYNENKHMYMKNLLRMKQN